MSTGDRSGSSATTGESSEEMRSIASFADLPKPLGRTPSIKNKGKRIAWQQGKVIGHGGFSTVYVGLENYSRTLMAAKVVRFCPDERNIEVKIQQLANEIKVMRNLQHNNIVRYIAAERVEMDFYIFMEYVAGGSLLALCEQFTTLSVSLARSFTHQILEGLEYLHGNSIVHRDIKCANLLLTVDGVLKLADFGSAQFLTHCDGFHGTPHWMAPEVVKGESVSWQADIWSLGCTVMEMLTGKPPFGYLGNSFRVMNFIAGSEELFFPDGMFDSLTESFLRLCLHRDPNQRPTASSLLEHFFVVGADVTSFPSSIQSTPKHNDQDGVHPTSPSPKEYTLATSEGFSNNSLELNKGVCLPMSLQQNIQNSVMEIALRQGGSSLTEFPAGGEREKPLPVNEAEVMERIKGDFVLDPTAATIVIDDVLAVGRSASSSLITKKASSSSSGRTSAQSSSLIFAGVSRHPSTSLRSNTTTGSGATASTSLSAQGVHLQSLSSSTTEGLPSFSPSNEKHLPTPKGFGQSIAPRRTAHSSAARLPDPSIMSVVSVMESSDMDKQESSGDFAPSVTSTQPPTHDTSTTDANPLIPPFGLAIEADASTDAGTPQPVPSTAQSSEVATLKKTVLILALATATACGAVAVLGVLLGIS